MRKKLFVLLIAIIVFSFVIVLQKTLYNLKIKQEKLETTFNIDKAYEKEKTPNTIYKVEDISSDLIRVCVDIQEDQTMCDYFDYWTNNRTGAWELIQRDNGATEGSHFCEYFEKWKVAKNIECRRFNGQESFVTY